MSGESLSFNTETANDNIEINEIPRQKAKKLGEMAMGAALREAMPPTPPQNSSEKASSISDEKRARFEALVAKQQEMMEAENGKSQADSILDRAEKAPDAYSQSELVDAKLATSKDAIIAALSVNPENRQLIEMLESALGNIKSTGAEELLRYDPASKKLSSIESPSSSKIINFPIQPRNQEPDPSASQPPFLESA